MDRLNKLEQEYKDAGKRLAFPLSLGERQQLTLRRQSILQEAKAVAEELEIQGDCWFTSLL
jgi:hypothetical protein